MDGETSGERLVAAFERWAAGERSAEQAASRSRTAWLTRQSAASATWLGVLVDLAERGAAVAVGLASAQLHGRLVGLGRDFGVLESHGGRPVVISLAAVCSLTPTEGSAWPGGQRSPVLSLGLASVFEALMEDRAPVVIHTDGPMPIDGEIMAVGEDVLTLRGAQPPRRPIYIPLTGVAYCELR